MIRPIPDFRTWRLYVLFSICLFAIFPLHESAHYLAYRTMGIYVPMTLNTASPVDQAQRRPIAELAGPLLNLFLALACIFAYSMTKRGRLLWAALGMAAAFMRLVIYVIIVIAAIVTGSGMAVGNDEPIAAHLWGLPSLAFVAAFAPIFVFVVWHLMRAFPGSTRRKLVNVLGLMLVTLAIGMLVGNVIDPWLFPQR